MKKIKRYIKDYARKKYQNLLFHPLPERQKRQKIKKIIFLLGFLTLILIFSGITFFLFFTPYFRFQNKNIQIKGNTYTPALKIKNFCQNKIFASSFLGNNYWLFNKKKAQKEIKKHFLFQKVTINTKFPHFLEINIQEERPIFLFWCHNGDFLVDKKGRAFAVFPRQKKPLAPVIKNCPQGQLYQTIISPDKIALCWQILKVCQQKNIPISYLAEEKYNNIKFYLPNGRYLFFNLNNEKEVKKEIEKLNNFLKNKDKNNFSQYADFRFGEKIYYK